jgi:branched-chain amino acid transport system permease protein
LKSGGIGSSGHQIFWDKKRFCTMEVCMTFFIQNIFNALQWGSFYSMIALGYCLVYGVLRLINFAHGDIFMTSTYIAFFVVAGLTAKFAGLAGVPLFVITLVCTMAFTNS